MSDYQEQVMRLMEEAHGESDSDVALLEEAARIADVHGDVELGLDVRIKLINAANFSGNYELMLVGFTWCLAHMDRQELRDDQEWDVLWYYKWVINSLSDYAQVSKQQIEQSFADMTERYKRAGYGLGAIYNCQAHTSLRLGDIESHRKARELARNSPRESMSDCAACVTNSAVLDQLELGEFEKAVKTAKPIIDGRQVCAEVPTVTFAALLVPLLKLGEADLAERLHRTSVRKALSTRDFTQPVGEHCAYLALAGKANKALRPFETGMAGVMLLKRSWDRMNFLQNAAVLFEVLAKGGDEAVRMKVVKSAPFFREDETYKPSVVAKALNDMSSGLAAEFDQRNGNSYMTERLRRFRGMVGEIANAR